MNNSEVIMKVSEKSGVNADDCQKVLEAFEDVLSDELSNSKDISGAFDKFFNVLSFLKNKKR
ncbi:HU family DNA-binding protein [Siminovitchia fortis]|uniref:HU family DNA-binding protein n=1 Tax=Siminovitchia fortis TaxID=254758 RepID=UPI0011A219FF|nr:HU family DNA-binding protein [Siminovitchia fortis]